MLDMIQWGQALIYTFRDTADWLSTEIGTLGALLGPMFDALVAVVDEFAPASADVLELVGSTKILPFETVGSLLIGTGFTFLLGWKVVRFFVDTFL